MLSLGARGEAVRELQRQLRELGYDPGPMDGVFGRRTRRAVRALQRDAGLVPDGKVGPRTRAVLAAGACDLPESQRPAFGDPPWLLRALDELAAWSRASARERSEMIDKYIFDFFDDIGRGQRIRQNRREYDYVRRRWCAVFVGWVLRQSGEMNTRSAGAMSYRNWGREVTPECGPFTRRGAIAVFRRSDGTSTDPGHVGFYVGRRGRRILVLGGNQSERVKVSSFSVNKLVGYRWPATAI